MRNCLTALISVISSAGPSAQPIFQPVAENVLPAEEIRTVRSRMPGNVGQRQVLGVVEGQMLVHLVADHQHIVLRPPAAIATRSARSSTAPVGLCGELINSALVRA